MGWKRRGKAIYCRDCWRKLYVLRAVTIPVVSPLTLKYKADETLHPCDWDEFGKRLREQWALITQASNWMMTEMYMRDDRSRDKGKLQPMPGVYLYPETRKQFPGMASQTTAALENQIGKKYRAKRFDVIWTCRASLPTFRYPTPLPVPHQAWSIRLDDNCPLVSAPIGDARVEFRLRNGHQFRRQLLAVKQIIADEAEPGQMDLYRQGKSVMCKLVAWLPRRPVETKIEGTLFVRADAQALLVALNVKDDRLWTYHGDQARRWSAAHRRLLQRLADDSKAEHRPTVPFHARREAAALKYRDRMSSLTHQIAAMTVNYALRRKFAAVRYDDTARDLFCPHFPWHILRLKLAEKCDAAGIEFHAVTPGEPEEVLHEPVMEE
ncbi:MAG TPA: hypothetical protein VK789_09350 [Bryobacteraceae bacterium]|jgi:hypothetical protein|nr:hypothetical protein [Bryobacteraceae bacterium]